MYTVERLTNIALEAEAVYNERSKLFPAGTFDQQRNDARRLMDKATTAAEELELLGVAEVQAINEFCDFTIKNGETFVLKAGAKVRSRGQVTINKRTRKVKAHYMNEGWTNAGFRVQSTMPSRNPEIVWAGSGGYWCYADFNDIEKI